MVPRTIQTYLAQQRVSYRLHPHARSFSSYSSAHFAGIDPHQLAKGVLLHDPLDDEYLLAIIPADHQINLHRLNQLLLRHLTLATEAELDERFPDCDPGAVPALGQPYAVELVWDEALDERHTLYLESGDHETLLAIEPEDFHRLYQSRPHGAISDHVVEHGGWWGS